MPAHSPTAQVIRLPASQPAAYHTSRRFSLTDGTRVDVTRTVGAPRVLLCGVGYR